MIGLIAKIALTVVSRRKHDHVIVKDINHHISEMQMRKPLFTLMGEQVRRFWHFQFAHLIVVGEPIDNELGLDDLGKDFVQLISDKQSVSRLQGQQATFRRWDSDAVAPGPRLDEIQQAYCPALHLLVPSTKLIDA
jgi:hypothetical protein